MYVSGFSALSVSTIRAFNLWRQLAHFEHAFVFKLSTPKAPERKSGWHGPRRNWSPGKKRRRWAHRRCQGPSPEQHEGVNVHACGGTLCVDVVWMWVLQGLRVWIEYIPMYICLLVFELSWIICVWVSGFMCAGSAQCVKVHCSGWRAHLGITQVLKQLILGEW